MFLAEAVAFYLALEWFITNDYILDHWIRIPGFISVGNDQDNQGGGVV